MVLGTIEYENYERSRTIRENRSPSNSSSVGAALLSFIAQRAPALRLTIHQNEKSPNRLLYTGLTLSLLPPRVRAW